MEYLFNAEEPRYELEQWPRHLRAAEEAWPEAERDAESRKRWNKLYNTVESFLSQESPVYRCWSKRVYLWHQKPLGPLHVAARYGLLGMMQRYISHGINVDVLDEDRWTPLHYTCWDFGRNVGLKLLVQHDAEVNALTELGQTPLTLLAAGSGPPELFQYLLNHGAKPEVPDQEGWTCLHFSATNRNLELCKILLGRSTVDVNARNSDGDTPLHLLFRFPNASPELVKLLLDHGANVNEQNQESQGPLFAASLVGNVTATRMLLDYNADINDDENVFGRTALHAAVEASNLELVKLLIGKGADVYRQDKKGRDCFAIAADENQVDIIDFLLETWKSQGATTLHLLTKDLDGDTPLHRSALKGSEKAVDSLLRAGDAATMCSLCNHNNATPLHMAASRGHRQVVEIILNHGANPRVMDNLGKLPLDDAFQGWKDDYQNTDFEETINLLAPRSREFAQIAGNLDFAIEKGAVKFIELLDRPYESMDIHGWTSIILAVECGHYEVANALSRNVQLSNIEASDSETRATSGCPPSRWTTGAMNTRLSISESGLEVTYPDGKLLPKRNYVASTHGAQTQRVLHATIA